MSEQQQREFVVRWEMPLLATTPREAAELACEVMRDPTMTATFFEVFWGDPDESEMTEVNLDELEGCSNCGGPTDPKTGACPRYHSGEDEACDDGSGGLVAETTWDRPLADDEGDHRVPQSEW